MTLQKHAPNLVPDVANPGLRELNKDNVELNHKHTREQYENGTMNGKAPGFGFIDYRRYPRLAKSLPHTVDPNNRPCSRE